MPGTTGLNLHTTTDVLGLALAGDGIRAQCWAEGRKLAEVLQVRMQAFIEPFAWEDLGWIGVCVGPGSFTGTRIGVVAARTLGQALTIPVLGVLSLDALAEASDVEGTVAVSLDARRGDRFVALYRRERERLQVQKPTHLVLASEWPDWLTAAGEPVHIDGDQVLEPPVASLARLAQRQFEAGEHSAWFAVEPFYGRPAPIHGGAGATLKM